MVNTSRRRWIGLLALWLCAVALLSSMANAPTVSAQTPELNSRLWASINGDLYDWTRRAGLRQRTRTGGNVGDWQVSLDGTWLVYARLVPVNPNPPELFQIGLGLPVDLYLLDTASYKVTSIATQPEDYAFLSETKAIHYVARSSFAWSPDGQRLAWVETEYAGQLAALRRGEGITGRLVIYDLQTGAQVVNRDIPHLPAQVAWGPGGIAVYLPPGDDDPRRVTRAVLYAPDGSEIERYTLAFGGGLFWDNQDSQDVLCIWEQTTSDRVACVPPGSGKQPSERRVPVELYNRLAPDGLAIDYTAKGGPLRIQFTRQAENQRLTRERPFLVALALGPQDGQFAFAWRPTNSTTIEIFDGRRRVVVGTVRAERVQLDWAPTALRLRRP